MVSQESDGVIHRGKKNALQLKKCYTFVSNIKEEMQK